MIMIMILGMEQKNQVNWATHSGAMAISQFSSETAKWKSLQILYSKFHGLLKLIFHTYQYNGA